MWEAFAKGFKVAFSSQAMEVLGFGTAIVCIAFLAVAFFAYGYSLIQMLWGGE